MPVPKGSSKHGKPAFGQAAHIIAKFGGESKMAAVLTEAGHKVSRITLYRWQYQPPAGTNGIIPNHQRAAIVAVARLEGVLLTEEDWAHRRMHYKPEEIV